MEIKTIKPHNKTYLFGLGFVFFASLILFLVEARNHGILMSDFEVYYRSASRLWRGANLYRIQIDDYFIYKYAPSCAAFFIPFIIFPLPIAKILYWFSLTVVAASSFFLSFQLAFPGFYKRSPSKFNRYIFLITLSLGLFLYRDFRLGQVNLILFLSYLLMLRFYQLEKPIPIALIWAAGIMFKPWGLIFLPYFLLKKKFKIISFFVLFVLIITLLPIIFYSFSDLIEQTKRWFYELAVELGNKQDLGADENHTIFSILYRYTPLRFLEISGYWKAFYQLIVLSLLGVLTLLFIRRGLGMDRKEVGTWALLIALMPLIAQSSYNVFLMVGLALATSFIHFKQLSLLCKVLLITGIILLGGNYNDLWGTDLSDKFLWLSLVAIGAILVLFQLFYLRFKKIA